MNRRHLVLLVAGCLALSSSTLAMAEGKSKQVRSKRLAHGKVLTPISPSTPITVGSTSGILTVDTSTAVPKFQFDTSTATSHIDLDSDDDGKEVGSKHDEHEH